MKKPCVSCDRVVDPANCDNKDCKAWRQWYIATWDDMRRAPRVNMEQVATVPEGTVIGGVRYALPHRVHDYLRNDPCSNCLCPRDLCTIPCRIKREWKSAWDLLH